MASKQKNTASAIEIDRLATQLAKDPHSKAFLPLAEEYCKVGMWEEAVSVLEEGLKHYPGFITAMVVLGRAYDQLNQPTKAQAVLEGAVKLSPENLRAHRTLIKIYTAQGLTEHARASCNVILTMNPKDEEALSAQASLGEPSQPQSENKQRPVERELEADSLTQPVRMPIEASATEQESEPQLTLALEPTRTAEEDPAASQRLMSASEELIATANSNDSATTPINLATSIMETALEENRQRVVEESSTVHAQARIIESVAAPSPHAETIVKLESWLNSIQRKRRDHVAS